MVRSRCLLVLSLLALVSILNVVSADNPTTSPSESPSMSHVPSLVPTSEGPTPPTPYRPHILYIMMDDLGSKDLGIHGSGIRTPVIDRMARDGVYLNNFYTLAACTQTRIAALTGRYPYRMGIYSVLGTKSRKGLLSDEETLAHLVRRAGYSAHAVGKWHLGHSMFEQTPTFRGFQSFYGFYASGSQDHFTHMLDNSAYDMRWDKQEFCNKTCSQIPDDRGVYSSDLFARETVKIIQGHDTTNQGPLFVYLPFAAMHKPLQVPSRYIDEYKSKKPTWTIGRQVYAGMLSAADDAIETVLQALVAKDMWKDTLVIFQTDNGGYVGGCVEIRGKRECGVVSNNRYSGEKQGVWQGGILGDGFISGPALPKLGIPSGRRNNALFHTLDWFPTLAAILGVKPQGKPLDGINQLGALKYGTTIRQELFLGYEQTDDVRQSGLQRDTSAAYIQGKWKLITNAKLDKGKPGKMNMRRDRSKSPRKRKKMMTIPTKVMKTKMTKPKKKKKKKTNDKKRRRNMMTKKVKMMNRTRATKKKRKKPRKRQSQSRQLGRKMMSTMKLKQALYDLSKDPNEERDISGENRSVVRTLSQRIEAYTNSFPRSQPLEGVCGSVTTVRTSWSGNAFVPWCALDSSGLP